ncbi:hypothetical protein ARMGADRAFT_1008975 [Armillaria gallica]|uniref:Uncharacterized protein n=1 Tax=Armillaria gallica TaxID=47427 RepID=A0A2H3DTP0_ARMGA|nr:hypothetical protein ARMGADRAFT_1008975 [Armillaria gallica]
MLALNLLQTLEKGFGLVLGPVPQFRSKVRIPSVSGSYILRQKSPVQRIRHFGLLVGSPYASLEEAE